MGFVAIVVSQSYSVHVMEEAVLRGNSAILKCHIPSFVADYVYVSSWLREDGTEIFPSDKDYGISKI